MSDIGARPVVIGGLDRYSSVFEVEVVPGVYVLSDESCWHPLPGGGKGGPDAGPNRPCHPYESTVDGPRATAVDHLTSGRVGYRLTRGFVLLSDGPGCWSWDGFR